MIKKINILFFSGIFLVFILFLWTNFNISQKNHQIVVNDYLNKSKLFLPLIVDENIATLKKQLKENQFILLKNIDGKIIYNKDITFGNIQIIKKGLNYYLKINYLNDSFIFFNKNQQIFKEKFILYIFVFGVLAIFIILYILIRKLFKPIEEISNKLTLFSKGDYDISMDMKGEREIEILSKSFNDMTMAIKSSIKDREDFMKYIGHELKTPIAKLKFAIEKKDIKKISTLTKNIEELINELIFVHLITKENMKKEKFLASTLILEAISKLYVEEEKIDIEIKDFEIVGDLGYLSIAVKNVIDNALKYSIEYPIKIVAKNNQITICNKGDKIDIPFEEMTKLFVKKSSGFGIGLNIVKRVCEVENIKFSYFYENGYNCFKLQI